MRGVVKVGHRICISEDKLFIDELGEIPSKFTGGRALILYDIACSSRGG